MNQTNILIKNYLLFSNIQLEPGGLKRKIVKGRSTCLKKEKLSTKLKTTNKYVTNKIKILFKLLNLMSITLYESTFTKLILTLKNSRLQKYLLQYVFFLVQNIKNKLISLAFIYTLLNAHCNLKFNCYGRNTKTFVNLVY